VKIKRHQDREVFGLSFLDIISCSFAAMLSLLILARNAPNETFVEPINLSSLENINNEPFDATGLTNQLAELELETMRKRSDFADLEITLKNTTQEIEQIGQEIAIANREISSAQNELTSSTGSINSIYSGGVPVGSEYLIFIVDTSGSMQAYWQTVMTTLTNIINVHPDVKGIQFMNDNGEYLLEGYADTWIPDTLAIRNRVVDRLVSWNSVSNSSPAEGLEKALRTYARRYQGLSIFVLGDDYTGSSYDDVISVVEQWNRSPNGENLAVIHGIGFPWGIGDRFATLMRELSLLNQGVFLGI